MHVVDHPSSDTGGRDQVATLEIVFEAQSPVQERQLNERPFKTKFRMSTLLKCPANK